MKYNQKNIRSTCISKLNDQDSKRFQNNTFGCEKCNNRIKHNYNVKRAFSDTLSKDLQAKVLDIIWEKLFKPFYVESSNCPPLLSAEECESQSYRYLSLLENKENIFTINEPTTNARDGFFLTLTSLKKFLGQDATVDIEMMNFFIFLINGSEYDRSIIQQQGK